MVKLKNPLMSLKATGRLGKLFSLAKRQGRNIIETRPIPTDARSPAQLFSRHMFSKCVALWHLLSEAERQQWESLARSRHMTGYAWFVSQCLRPNPGIYLPLQGGKMSGDIDMDGNRIEDLPDPLTDHEAATKKYHDDNLPPGGYIEGCRVWRTATQSIPNATYTHLIFDAEVYDTDEMHDLVVNPERITIKTAGIYLVTFHGDWAPNATGYRRTYIRLNDTTIIVNQRLNPHTASANSQNLSTLYQCSVDDFLKVRVYQNRGNALSMYKFTQYSPVFTAQRVG